MKLQFNIEYITALGEQLALVVEHADNQAVWPMASADGAHWQAELTLDADTSDMQKYHYAVYRGRNEVRHEWLVAPHRLDLVATAVERYTILDRWIDSPEDAPLYSSAFTDCIVGRKLQPLTSSYYKHTLRLIVRAPQLTADEHLVVVGAPRYLGAWNPAEGRTMVEHAYGEWVCDIDADHLPTTFEWKFVAIGNNDSVAWETASNRTLFMPAMRDREVVVVEQLQPRFDRKAWRGAGTVVPIFSLRSEGSCGVGDFGDLKLMIEFCAKTHQRILQVLPINDTNITHTWQDSYPYNAISIYALHPQYCDLRQLPPLSDQDFAQQFETLRTELNALSEIDYERMMAAKMDYLCVAYREQWNKLRRTKAYREFYEANKEWLEPYAKFLTDKDNSSSEQANTNFWYFVQYHLDRQMRAAHDYARQKHVILKGDIPIGISREGVEAWAQPRYFNLNGQAGAPPDAFSVNGQNWGFPTYDWEAMLADGCQWWVNRFQKMQQYFDAYRIDHVLGFFRIWEIPIDAVHGLLGQFSPALPMTREEIEAYGLHFRDSFVRPYIADWTIERIFGQDVDYVRSTFLQSTGDGRYQMLPQFDTQRKVEAWYRQAKENGDADGRNLENLRDGLYALISCVLFVPDHKDPSKCHPRISAQNDFAYLALDEDERRIFNRLYNDYYYRRHNRFWYDEAMKKLPRLTQSTRMLCCAEDLGMVPECVPWVMNELRILSLEIQSMPKDPAVRFGQLYRNPYLSVATISTHDMPTLRQWWDEDPAQTQAYYNTELGHDGDAPHPLPGWLAREIVQSHLASPSMLCLLSLQDWLAISERLRLPDAGKERINIPANPRHYWRYRMHLSLEQLAAETDFCTDLQTLIDEAQR